VQTIGLTDLLRLPECVLSVVEADWNEIIEHASQSQLMGQLAARLKQANLYDDIPKAVRRHLELAELTSRQRSAAAMWEVNVIRRALDPKIRIVLLKGCAYSASADENAVGRMFSDVDIMVQRDVLETVESHLISLGWKPPRLSGYDSRYYRNWMHEVPAMEHVRRHTVVDLHHAINPPVSRCYISPSNYWEQVVELSKGIYVLSPVDRIIHCALHLIQEGESAKLLRDLYDLNLLIDQHCGWTTGLSSLLHRANELGVQSQVQSAVSAAQSIYAKGDTGHVTKDWLGSYLVVAAKVGPKKGAFAGQLAGLILLAYSHFIKMPLRLLAPHLLHKLYIKITGNKT